MNYAIPIDSNKKTALISKKFARSDYFAIVNKEQRTYEIIENPYKELKLGVGKKLLKLLAEQHQVSTLVAFELGLKVQQMANESKLQLIVLSEKRQTLKQLLTYLKVE